jgi:hypothetical protein
MSCAPIQTQDTIMKNLLATLFAATLVAATTAQQNVCTTQVAGVGCGPQLTVSFAPIGGAGNHRVAVDVANMNPNGIGLMVWGREALNVPLFGCFAYTDFLWGHPINPDASGAWSWSRSWPNTVQGFYRIQVATIGPDPLGNVAINLTDCVVAECSQ